MWILRPLLGFLFLLAPAPATPAEPVPVLAGPPVLAADDPGWTLQSSEDGIALYRCQVKGSGVVPVKAVMTIPGTIAGVSLVLQDIPRRPEWIGTRTKSTLLQRVSHYEQYEYLRVYMPWPVADRSAIIRALISVSDDRTRATISARSVASHPAADTLPKLVRSQVHTSTFQMTQSGDQVEVVALVFIDPGGHVPKWLVNWFAGRMARSTLHDLRKQVAKHLYPPAQVHEMERRIREYPGDGRSVVAPTTAPN
jgi:hypothetical protein